MAITKSTPQYTNIDFSTGAKIENLPQSTTTGMSVEHDQLNTTLLTKQDNISGGAGVLVENNVVSVDLSTTDADYSTLIVTGSANPVLDGEYTRASYAAYLDRIPDSDGDFDLGYGGDFAFFYKNNGNGTWSIVGGEDSNGSANVSDSDDWLGMLTVINPATVSASVSDFIIDSNQDRGGIREIIADAHDLDENNKLVPTPTDTHVAYGSGTSDSYMEFDGGKLRANVVTVLEQATSVNLLAGSTVKTALEEAETRARVASNTSFSNSVASIAGNPTNVQTMGEALENEIDVVTNIVSGHTLQLSTINSRQSSLADAIGVGLGQDDMGTFGGSGAVFLTGATTAKEGIEGAAAGAATALSVLGTVLGLNQGDVDFGDGFTILPNDEDAKTLFQAIESELQALSSGAGATWAAGVVEVVETSDIDISNPATDTFGGETLAQNDILLLVGQTNLTENGFYKFDTTSTAMVRWVDADATADFIQNRSVQIVADGTEWAYKGVADPVIGSTDITFEKIRESIIADLSVSEVKLAEPLATKINDKCDKFVDTSVTITTTGTTVTHGLNSEDVIVSVRDAAGNFINTVEIDSDTLNSIKITSTVELVNMRVVVIG